jgi:hypothetical protein
MKYFIEDIVNIRSIIDPFIRIEVCFFVPGRIKEEKYLRDATREDFGGRFEVML